MAPARGLRVIEVLCRVGCVLCVCVMRPAAEAASGWEVLVERGRGRRLTPSNEAQW